jgi:hypothetical protein
VPGQAANARAIGELGLPENVVEKVWAQNAMRVYAGINPNPTTPS